MQLYQARPKTLTNQSATSIGKIPSTPHFYRQMPALCGKEPCKQSSVGEMQMLLLWSDELPNTMATYKM